MGTIPEDLKGPEVELEETHISWVFLHPEEVFKVKKPVAMGFLDFSTPELRRQACEAEVELNRRLAPGIYRGVLPITRGPDGRHRLRGEGPAVDWAVEMRRLPLARRADQLLAAGHLGPEELEAIATHLASFHASARCDGETGHYGAREVIAGNVRENFEQTRETVADYISPAEAAEIEAWQLTFLAEHGPLFARRIETGRVRDGHGDLRLEHVYLEGDEVTIIDCIEFNRRFRFADVAADVAFLSMDLASRDRADLAEIFLAAYAREANDFDLYPLVDFYESYRAHVRAKVASFMAAGDGDLPRREMAAAEARHHYLLALACERRSLLPPVVVAVGGWIAAGKSTVARRLGQHLAAPVVDADRTRKHLLGVEATTPVHVGPFEGAYSATASIGVYAELRRRAGAVLASGRPVVVDASFRSRQERARFRELAREVGVPFTFVECRVSPEIARERLALRDRERGVSDGRLEIFDAFHARFEAVTELPPEEHFVLDTTRDPEENLARLVEVLPAWPPGLTP